MVRIYKIKNKQEHEQLSDEFECLSRRRTDMNVNIPEFKEEKINSNNNKYIFTQPKDNEKEEEENEERRICRKEIK